MISAVQKLLALLDTFGGLSKLPIASYFAVLQQVWAAVQGVADAKTAADFHTLAASVLRPIVALTVNPWDDGALLAIEALGRDQAWLDWCNQQLAEKSFADPLLLPGVPEGALGIQAPQLDIPPDAQALNLVGGLAALAKIRELLPFFLAIVEVLQQLRGAQQPLTDE